MSLPPLVEPIAELTPEQVERASRHIMLPGFGVLAQRRLAAARVLVIGAGGLGSPVLQYLAGAGIGTIGIVDSDVVDRSNLQRQVIHRTADVGERKTTSAARAISAIDPDVTVVQHDVHLDSGNAIGIVGRYDLVVDGSDNFPTRYLVSDAAALLGVPCVWGSVLRFDGQITVFWAGAPDGAALDYRDLHPAPPDASLVLSCDEAGVVGALCGTIGSMMAVEAVKLVTGLGEPLLGRLQTFDAGTGSWRESTIRRGPTREPVRALVDYEAFCGVAGSGGLAESSDPVITATQLAARGPAGLIDVREPFEHEITRIPGDRLVPLAELLADPALAGPGSVVVYCKTGARSARAARALRDAGIDAVSLRGGVLAWIDEVEPGGIRY